VTRRIVAIVGTTATGKTDLGGAIAELVDGEVVCADARQLFRELEIGTGKPTFDERERRRHHLFDALSLEERTSAGGYARLARAVCEGVLARGRVPVLVGGSGLYLRALREGLHAEPPHDAAVRERWREALAASGPQALHAQLAERDPPTAARLDPRDGQRITRALEVAEASGRPLSWWHTHAPRERLEGDWRVIECVASPRALAERIAARTRAMFAGSLIEETAALRDAGREGALRRLRAIGYDEALELIEGRLDRAAAEARTDQRTRQLAKRQRTWFRHQVDAPRIDASAGADVLAEALLALGLDAGGRG
jgi:tRNA dimethylallyltransferase